ncbi:MAG TPA: PDZ domain-containing protein [Thermoanaerobacterales bacterium]|nr:PDZ domain-containing protein [Thermoanaerobacterales bacterium]
MNPFFWLVIFIVWNQYKRTAALEQDLFGTAKINPRDKILYAIFYGILGGIIGSLAVMLLGISITEAGLIYVWPLALILAFIHPHLMCFSYAGGIVALFSLVTGLLRIDVAGLMGLVAILHFVESLLIYFAGHINATPVFVKDERYGIVGGFSLQEFWPVPIMLLTIITGDFSSIDVVQMPDWWPLIRPPAHILQNTQAIYLMLPVVAALGYGDIALTKTPKNRCKSSAVNLLAFSCILLLLSVLASRYMVFTYLAAIFAPAGHEFLIITGKKSERKNKPLFTPPEKGEMILDIIKNSPTEKMGLSSGDIILSINGQDLEEPGKLQEVLSEYPTYIWMTIKTPDEKTKSVEISAYPNGINSIGAILVPRDSSEAYVIMERRNLIDRIKRFFKKGHN